jgi:hypothetical protein
MQTAEDLIEKIVNASKIAGGGRRKDIARELRAHLEDFALAARQSGHLDSEIQAMILAHFGDPEQIARDFARVYRKERTILYTSAFLVSTLAAAGVIAAIVFMVQVTVVMGLGIPAPRIFETGHLTLEAGYLLATVAAYLGQVSLESLFERSRFEKALAILSAIFCVAGVIAAFSVGHAGLLLLAFASGVVIRALQICCSGLVRRAIAVAVVFGVIGVVSACLQPSEMSNTLAVKVVMWVAIGLSCQFMTSLSLRVDRALLKGVRPV